MLEFSIDETVREMEKIFAIMENKGEMNGVWF